MIGPHGWTDYEKLLELLGVPGQTHLDWPDPGRLILVDRFMGSGHWHETPCTTAVQRSAIGLKLRTAKL